MQCPTCKTNLLVTVEFDAIEVDYCPACGGVWLDTGEIEAILGDEAMAARLLVLDRPADSNEEPRRCPECRAKMSKGTIESTPPVLYDHCPNGDGLWFDKGELHTVIEHAESLGDAAPVAKQLRTLFAGAPAGGE